MSAYELITLRAHEHGVRASDVLGRSRESHLVCLRAWIAAEFRCEPWRMSLPQIGRMLGRDHTTILHLLRHHDRKRVKP